MPRRKKEVPLTLEQIRENVKNHFIKTKLNEESHFHGTPSYHFNVGDIIIKDNSKVLEVVEDLGDGIAYVVSTTRFIDKKGNKLDEPKIDFIADFWHKFRPSKNTRDYESLYQEKKFINSSVMQGDISSLIYHITSGIKSPSYQRGYVWSETDKVDLIDSIFKQIKIGTIVYRINDEVYVDDVLQPYREIVDGKQRLSAIEDFYFNRLKYKGLYYNDLTEEDRRWFLRQTVPFIDLDHRVSDEEVIELFIRMNTMGKIMSKDDIDNALEEYKKVKNI